MVPPTVATATVHGSWPHVSPWSAAAWFNAWMVTPAPTSAMRSAGRTWISWSPRRSSTSPGTSDAAPPISPLPPPMGITGTPCVDARPTTAATSAVCSGRTTHNGSATVQPGIRPGWSASRAKTLSVLWSVYTLLGGTASWRACSSAFSDIDTSILRRHNLKVVVLLQDPNEAHRKRQMGNRDLADSMFFPLLPIQEPYGVLLHKPEVILLCIQSHCPPPS